MWFSTRFLIWFWVQTLYQNREIGCIHMGVIESNFVLMHWTNQPRRKPYILTCCVSDISRKYSFPWKILDNLSLQYYYYYFWINSCCLDKLMRTSINFWETISPFTLLKSGQSPVLIPQELIYSIKDDSRQPLKGILVFHLNGQMTQISYEQTKTNKGMLLVFGFVWYLLVLHMVETPLAHTIYLGGVMCVSV